MITEGQIVLFKFLNTTQQEDNLHPVLILRSLPSKFDDWLVCMISSQLHHFILNFDEIISCDDIDFKESGLKNQV